MFCEQCGKEVAENAKFCKYCGAPVEGEASKAANETPAKPEKDPVKKAEPAAEQGSAPKVDTTSRKKEEPKKSKLLYGLLGLAGLVLVIIGIVYFATVNTTGAGDLAGEWNLMSGNEEEDSYYEDTSGFPSYVDIHKDKTIAFGEVTGEYKLSYTEKSLSINDGEFLYEYKVFDDGNLLYLMEYGSDSGNGDAGIYINLDKATDEEIEAYEYAMDAYDSLDIQEYLTGYWYDTDGVVTAADDEFSQQINSDFAIYEDDNGKHMSYSLPIPDAGEDATFSVEGNLITHGELNAYRIIPIGEKKAYFFCYADSTLRTLKKY